MFAKMGGSEMTSDRNVHCHCSELFIFGMALCKSCNESTHICNLMYFEGPGFFFKLFSSVLVGSSTRFCPTRNDLLHNWLTKRISKKKKKNFLNLSF